MPAAIKVKPGDKYGMLTIMHEASRGKRSDRRFMCSCDCGTEKVISLHGMRTGNSLSCGCQTRLATAERNTSHGLSKRPEYQIWKSVRQRCNNAKSTKYYMYGAKGIKICDRWNDFSVFLADMGPMPSPTHEIDRFPNRSGDYEPGNCRWATQTEQARNRDFVKTVMFNGEERPIVELAEEYGIPPHSVHARLNAGWTIENALTVPVRKRKRQSAPLIQQRQRELFPEPEDVSND